MTATASRMLVSFQRLFAGGLAFGAPIAALAHHAHDYAPPENAWQAFASGLAHPFLSGPHLVALLALGMLAAAPGLGARTLLAFCAGSVLTALAFAAGATGWPAHDLWVAASLALAAAWLWRGQEAAGSSRLGALLVVGVAGSVHGQIAAESIEAVSAMMLFAYWSGIVFVQLALGGLAMAVLRSALAKREALAGTLRHACAALSAGAACGVLCAFA